MAKAVYLNSPYLKEEYQEVLTYKSGYNRANFLHDIIEKYLGKDLVELYDDLIPEYSKD